MKLDSIRTFLEDHQAGIYFAVVAVAVFAAVLAPDSGRLEPLINPALALMLFLTFLQVPLSQLGKAFTDIRFLATLALANFVVIPVLVWGLVQLLPAEPLLLLGVLFVLLTPCVDYVVTFSHLGRADAKALLAATPLLLLVQMALLPIYLSIMVGASAAAFVKPEPFLHAFAVLIAGPLALAAFLQFLARSFSAIDRAISFLGVLPVPATAFVLFVVIASVVPQLGHAGGSVLRVVPIYVLFSLTAPVLGWLVARAAGLAVHQRRAVAFSAATRNSLVILPLALAVPGAVPVIPAVIVAQTLIELFSELVYIRVIPGLDQARQGEIND